MSNYKYILIKTPEDMAKYGPKQKGDQIEFLKDDWRDLIDSVGRPFAERFIYRRPIVAEVTNAPISPWHPINDLSELPEDVTAKVELYNNDETRIDVTDSGHLQVTRESSQKYYTHWRLHIPPATEKKAVDEVEECYQELPSGMSRDNIRGLIAFALNWAKEREEKKK